LPLEAIFFLERIGGSQDWAVQFADFPSQALRLASQNEYDVILCDCNQKGHAWREVMDGLALRSPRSCILLVSPVKDDHVWLDVLQHHGFDILVRPLQESLTISTIEAAVRFINQSNQDATCASLPVR